MKMEMFCHTCERSIVVFDSKDKEATKAIQDDKDHSAGHCKECSDSCRYNEWCINLLGTQK